MVSAVDVPADDADRQLTVSAAGAVTLHCPLYRASAPVHITWLHADTSLSPVVVGRTRAISDNGTAAPLILDFLYDPCRI